MSDFQPHIPVMLDNVLAQLSPVDGGIYVDGTFGAGGYSRAFLASADCTVIAIDRDSTASEKAQALKDEHGACFIFIHGCFGDAEALLHEAGIENVDGFVLDLGVSSMQLDEAERGFSFRTDGPLDMRMDQNSSGDSAADIVNNYQEEDLADIIYEFGGERRSRRVAREIVKIRKQALFKTTKELADTVRRVVPKSKDRLDPATRTFQALRIAVNDEPGELHRALDAAEKLLKEGGVLIVVSFHSLEDRIVKRFLLERSGQKSRPSRHLPIQEECNNPTFTIPSRKAIFPSAEEVASNPRSRSARLRVAIRTAETTQWGRA